MKASIRRAAGLALCLVMTAGLLGGCARLLERSYGITEPYADRYWDSSAEDTLRAETYQDLVNSMLLLVEQQAEEGVIRCYDEADAYQEILAARGEVRRETMPGSYLLEDLQITYEGGAGYGTVTCHMTYREDAEDIGSLMTLSDSQSLVDLLRLAVREDYRSLTAYFVYDPPKEDVTAAVESFWQELCLSEMEENGLLGPAEEAGTPEDSQEGNPLEDGDSAPGEAAGAEEDRVPEEETPGEEAPEEGGDPIVGKSLPEGENPDEEIPPEVPPIEYPPCPWVIRFYPNQDTAKIVEVLLKR